MEEYEKVKRKQAKEQRKNNSISEEEDDDEEEKVIMKFSKEVAVRQPRKSDGSSPASKFGGGRKVLSNQSEKRPSQLSLTSTNNNTIPIYRSERDWLSISDWYSS